MIQIPLVNTNEEQLARWLAGEPVHVRSERRGESWQCCPDFSCCRAALLAPLEIRQAYVEADHSARARMAMRFLAQLVALSTTEPVLITDGERHISVNKGKKQ